MPLLRFIGLLLGAIGKLLWEVTKVVMSSIWGLLVAFVVVIGGLVLLLEFDVIGLADRGTTLSQIKQRIAAEGFQGAAVTGKSKQEDGKILMQEFTVFVGLPRTEYDQRAKECEAIVTWEDGELKLVSRLGNTQTDATSAQALTLPEYADCGKH